MSVLYPKTEGATFDHDYYRQSHVPLCVGAFAPISTEIDKGVDGPYVAAVHFMFDTMDTMGAAMAGPGLGDVMADMANYTTIQPVIQVSETV
jgi:uncharacterized protein (TIGR02118 family)